MVGVPNGDVHKEVIFAAHVIDTDDFGQREQVRPEGLDKVARMACHANRNKRLKSHAQRFGVDTRPVSRENPISLESSHAFEAGRGRQANGGGEFFVGDPCILLQGLEDLVVDSVKMEIGHDNPNCIRWICKKPNHKL